MSLTRRLISLLSLPLLLSGLPGALAAPPSQSSDPVVLEISGNLSRYTDAVRHVYAFHESEIRSLSQHTIHTKTNWTPAHDFSGPLVRDLLATVGAKGAIVEMVALDDYNVKIPMDDFTGPHKYDVVMARFLDGMPMTVKRSKDASGKKKDEGYGPFWVMYPLPDIPRDKQDAILEAKLVWQVNRIVVR